MFKTAKTVFHHPLTVIYKQKNTYIKHHQVGKNLFLKEVSYDNQGGNSFIKIQYIVKYNYNSK